jgi:hypothetical protein
MPNAPGLERPAALADEQRRRLPDRFAAQLLPTYELLQVLLQPLCDGDDAGLVAFAMPDDERSLAMTETQVADLELKGNTLGFAVDSADEFPLTELRRLPSCRGRRLHRAVEMFRVHRCPPSQFANRSVATSGRLDPLRTLRCHQRSASPSGAGESRAASAGSLLERTC